MDDRELLSLLAGDAPEPGGELADIVVRKGRRVRTRRRLTAVGGAAALLVAVGVALPSLTPSPSADKAAGAPVAASAPGSQRYADDSAESLNAVPAPEAPSGKVAPGPASEQVTDPRVDVYAAALAATPGNLFLIDETKEGLGKPFRTALRAALPGREIQFARNAASRKAATTYDADTGTALVVLGEAKVTGDTASVLLGRDGALPAPVRLTRKGGAWTVQQGG